jgi:hypothetical protein
MFTPNVPNKLDTQQYFLSAPMAPPPPPPMTIVKPMSYQFQVVEFTEDDKTVKVELQVQYTTHDEYGNVMFSSGFVPVPRVKLPYVK